MVLVEYHLWIRSLGGWYAIQFLAKCSVPCWEQIASAKMCCWLVVSSRRKGVNAFSPLTYLRLLDSRFCRRVQGRGLDMDTSGSTLPVLNTSMVRFRDSREEPRSSCSPMIGSGPSVNGSYQRKHPSKSTRTSQMGRMAVSTRSDGI